MARDEYARGYDAQCEWLAHEQPSLAVARHGLEQHLRSMSATPFNRGAQDAWRHYIDRQPLQPYSED
jgi:hypothetical protein